MIYIIGILSFFLAWAIFSALILKIFYREKAIDKLKYFDEDYGLRQKYENDNNKNKTNAIKTLSHLVPREKLNKRKSKKLEVDLMKADIPMTIAELLVIKIIAAVVLGFLAFAIFRDVTYILAFMFVAWNAPRFIIIKKKKQRIKKFDSQLNDGITIIANSLKAGYSFLQAVAVVTEEMPEPFSKEFKRLLKEMSLGISEDEALKNLLFRMDSADLKLLVNAILIQKDTGGNLSEILENISETIRDRQKIQGELKTLTAQGKLSGGIVMAIPAFLGLFIYTFNQEYIMVLFNTKIGIAMLVGALVNQFIGFLMIRKIVSIDM